MLRFIIAVFDPDSSDVIVLVQDYSATNIYPYEHRSSNAESDLNVYELYLPHNSPETPIRSANGIFTISIPLDPAFEEEDPDVEERSVSKFTILDAGGHIVEGGRIYVHATKDGLFQLGKELIRKSFLLTHSLWNAPVRNHYKALIKKLISFMRGRNLFCLWRILEPFRNA